MADDLFSTDPNTPPPMEDKNYLEELVGDGKKFKDAEALAKAKAESDRFIAQLLREKNEVTEALQKRIKEEDFLTKLESLSRAGSPSAGDNPPQAGTEATALTPEDIEKIIEKREADRTRKANIDKSLARLQEVYGDNYKQHVATQAQSLGVSTEFLTDVMARNPNAFFRVIGLDGQQTTKVDITPPRSAIAAQPQTKTGKNYAYYQDLRKTKGEAWYFTPSVQMEMWNSLKEQGEDSFYKR